MPDPTYIDVERAASFTGTFPAGLTEGDLMFFHVIGRGPGTVNTTISGWNLIGTATGVVAGDDVQTGLWWRIATASETAPTASATGSLTNVRVDLSVWRDAPAPIDSAVLAHDGSTSPLGLPEVDVPGRTMVVAFLASVPTISGWGGDGYSQTYLLSASAQGIVGAQAYRLYENTTWDNPELLTLGGVFFTVALSLPYGGIFVDGAVH